MKYLLVIVPVFFLACTAGPEPEDLFFDYDEVVYYSSDFQIPKDSASEAAYYTKKNPLRKILTDPSPFRMEDTTSFCKLIDSLSLKKQQIRSSDFDELNAVFSKHPIEGDIMASSCMPYYRDIFIFKKNHRITGVAKVCFQCKEEWIVGAKANTNGFGSNEDWERLKELLQNY